MYKIIKYVIIYHCDVYPRRREAEWRSFRAFFQQKIDEPLNRSYQENQEEYTRRMQQYDRQLAELKDGYESIQKS